MRTACNCPMPREREAYDFEQCRKCGGSLPPASHVIVTKSDNQKTIHMLFRALDGMQIGNRHLGVVYCSDDPADPGKMPFAKMRGYLHEDHARAALEQIAVEDSITGMDTREFAIEYRDGDSKVIDPRSDRGAKLNLHFAN